MEISKSFATAGASTIHMVDLDGALNGKPQHLELLSKVKKATGINLQFGGGIRDLESLKAIFSTGVDRAVLGTAAVDNPEFVKKAVHEFGNDKIVIGLDTKNGIVAIKGWIQSGGKDTLELITAMSEIGLIRFVYTDISRDGTLSSPNFQSISKLLVQGSRINSELKIIASGGIANIDHLHKLADIGVEGAIIGSALYTDRVDLSEAVNSLQRTN